MTIGIKGTRYKDWTIVEETLPEHGHRHYASLDIGKVFNVVVRFQESVWDVILQCKIADGVEHIQMRPIEDRYAFLDNAENWALAELVSHAQCQLDHYLSLGYRLQ